MPLILCGFRVDDATMERLKDSNPKAYVDSRLAIFLALFWRIGAISHN